MTNFHNCTAYVYKQRSEKQGLYKHITRYHIFFDNFTYLENVNHAMQNIQLAEQWLQFYPEQRISSETTVNNSPVGSSALL